MEKVLVANRGEIAIRILRSASELGWSTVAIYTENDGSHASFANEAVKLDNVDDFMKPEVIVRIATSTNCTHVHPGYGFLSENPALPNALAKAGSITFIGPSFEALQITSDKMLSRDLATSLGVNIAPGERVHSAANVRSFAQNVGYPVIIKALDGGGGRGIRVVDVEAEAEEAFKRSLGESPSKQIFVERAFTGAGWKHIEVQIIGDGKTVDHLWERECSVQRRFQKIVELAPSRLSRETVRPLVDASLKIAEHLKYKGLGTFEYLFNVESRDWVFLEINPRVQVEHTVTEEINDVDLVRAQLLLFTPGMNLFSLDLPSSSLSPSSYAIQLRLTAEDPSRTFQLSPGSIQAADVTWPAGRGIRVDTWLTTGPHVHKPSTATDWVVGADFDSLLAKIIVRGRSFEEVTAKACRALRETNVGVGTVKTNIAILAGVIGHPDWASNNIDTLWLERNVAEVLRLGQVATPSQGKFSRAVDKGAKMDVTATATGGSGIYLQPGTLFNLTLSPTEDGSALSSSKHSLTLNTIRENTFPSILSGVIRTSFSPSPLEFSLLQSTSAAVSSGAFEFADLNDTTHVSAPMTGKIVELHPVLLGEKVPVRKGDTLLVLSVMKMENVVLTPFDGYIERVGKGIRVGVVLGEGMLVCVMNGKTPLNRL